jgi:UDP-N-acetylmuramate: L-alanyl-gamma-D-glutamyl-meso-diaminopimelate ligase
VTKPPQPRGPLRRIHLIGICGTGMGSLAGLLREAGYEVQGSDQAVYPPMSTMLAERGIEVLDGYHPDHLSNAPDLVVVGNVATRTNPEAVAAVERGLPCLSMPQAIASLFLEGRHPIVVTGTHGKTTTAALMAWVLHSAGRRPSFLVGGVLRNFDRSYGLGAGEDFVIEGDEYETAYFDKGPKFMHYRPRTGILTSVEFDHAEMYHTLDEIKAAFRGFVKLLPVDGRLVHCADDPNVQEVVAAARPACPDDPYGTSEGGRWCGRILGTDAEGMDLEVTRDGRPFGEFRSPLSGIQNLRNILAVTAAAAFRGLDTAAIGTGLRTFTGVRRRQEVRGTAAGIVVLDDFAHHPTAVRLTLDGLRQRYGTRRLWAVFEPRTNTSRRSVFQQDYAESFDAADRVIVAAVDHPERAPEGQRFSPERLVADLLARGRDARFIATVPEIVAQVAREGRSGDVVVVMSNGSFGGIHAKLLLALEGRSTAAPAAGEGERSGA